ncbi:MAG TPA: 6-phosphogluconolactonase, partial [Pseudomonas sp.]|nr:6-phosphogluconolactonase [Pseudomonas sp.]
MTISNLDLPVQTLGFSLGNADQLAGELALTVSNALRSAIAERGAATLV